MLASRYPRQASGSEARRNDQPVVYVSDRAVYRHASRAAKIVLEFEPKGRAAWEIAQLHTWTCAYALITTCARVGSVAR